MAFEIFCAVFAAEFLVFFFFVYLKAKRKGPQTRPMQMQETAAPRQKSAAHTKKQRRLFYLAYHHRSARVRKKNLKRLKGVIT